MKRWISLFLVLVLMLSVLVGCKDESVVDSTGLKESEQSTETLDETNNTTYVSQSEFYRAFQEVVNSNAYDKWLEQVLADGELSLSIIYAKYSSFWVNEFNFTIDAANGLFENSEEYLLWKSELNKWLETTTNIIRIETEQMQGQMPQIEIAIQKCELIRQKVIDTKYFCYIIEHNSSYDAIENPVGLRWENKLSV